MEPKVLLRQWMVSTDTSIQSFASGIGVSEGYMCLYLHGKVPTETYQAAIERFTLGKFPMSLWSGVKDTSNRREMLKAYVAGGAPEVGLMKNFRQAKLAGIHMRGADLSFFDFTGADLRNVGFDGCALAYTRFLACKLEGATFVGCDVSETIVQLRDGSYILAAGGQIVT